MGLKLTAKGLSVMDLAFQIAFLSFSGLRSIQAVIVPNPPALETGTASSTVP